MVQDDLVECIVTLPGQLFYSTQIPVSLWFLSRNKANGHARYGKAWRDRRGALLFIDARTMGVMVDRTHRELTSTDIDRIASTYHAWRGEAGAEPYEDTPGYCASVSLDLIVEQGFVLTPGRYVGFEKPDDDDEPIEEKIMRLTGQLCDALDESDRLQARLRGPIGSSGSTRPTGEHGL